MLVERMARKNADHAHRKIFLKLVRLKAEQEIDERQEWARLHLLLII